MFWDILWYLLLHTFEQYSAILFNILCHNIEHTPSYFGLCSFILWLSQRWNIWNRSVCTSQIGLVWSSPKQTGLPQMFHLPGPLYQYGPISHIMGNTQDILTYSQNILNILPIYGTNIYSSCKLSGAQLHYRGKVQSTLYCLNRYEYENAVSLINC